MVENDPTKDLVNLMREEMRQSRELELQIREEIRQSREHELQMYQFMFNSNGVNTQTQSPLNHSPIHLSRMCSIPMFKVIVFLIVC